MGKALAAVGGLVALSSLVLVSLWSGADRNVRAIGGVDAIGSAGVDPASEQPLDMFRAERLSVATHEHNLAVAECMTRAGFPQLESVQEAWTLSNPYPGLRVERGAFGPDSASDAARYGYMPSFLRDRGPGPPQVVSLDPEYNKTLDDCVEAVGRDLGTSHDDAVSDFIEVGNQLVREFGSSLGKSDEIVSAFSDWLACMADQGYRGGGVDDYLASMYPPSFFGVPPGEWTGSGPEHTDVGSGVQILLPGEWVYEPTVAESRLGIADASCKIATNLWGRVYPELMDIQSAIVDRHADAIVSVSSRIEDAIDSAALVRQERQSP